MLRTRTRVETNRDAAAAVEAGVERSLFDAADKGFAKSQEDVPVGTTAGLKHSGFQPEKAPDGSIQWGYTAEYTLPVIDGSAPHWIPMRAMPDLKKWARRVLGDEAAAWAVRAKIAEEGTPPQDFIGPAMDVMRAHLRSEGIGGVIDEELRSR